MNIQELIKKYELELKDVQLKFGASFKTKVYEDLIKDLQQLDEPQKVTVPQFVADYIESEKDSECGLLGSMKDVPYEDNAELRKWFYKSGNIGTFVRAWLDGYEVEKEKRYLVKMKGFEEEYNFLNYFINTKLWIIQSDANNSNYRTHHTRKELEQAGFGWVFNCPGIDIEEVEE